MNPATGPANEVNPQILRRVARRAMIERGLQPEFSPEALQQAQSITQAASEQAAAVRDLTGLLWASIDNDDSRDLDQLSVAQPLDHGVTRILVAIADVDAIVRRGSPIDAHANANTTSVYTVAQIFPMLPEKLSTNLTSLGEDQERLAVVVEFSVSADGTLRDSRLYRATVRNRAKLAYDSVAAWLDGSGPTPARVAAVPGMDQQLRLQDKVAQSLKRVRHAHGALWLASSETRPVFDGELLRDLRPDESNRAKDLIADFMIAANGVAARYLAEKHLPSLRRVLGTPQKWSRIVELARELGETLPAVADAAALNQLLSKRREQDPAGFPDLSLSVIKLLGRGEYVLELPGQQSAGHFGLAVRDYTHSTAPNRRFPDVITQRLLKAGLGAAPSPYSADELQALAAHCTAQEDNAAKVERVVHKSAAALLLAPRLGQLFDGLVTGASSKGTWVRINSPSIEGRVVRGMEGLQVGAHVRVRLLHTDVERGFIDFERTK
jgi:VacB/RNase II family 3'-5' exoribonuclease